MIDEPNWDRYFARATRMKCPECGEHPLFTPLRETRTLRQWMHPLEGCPKCGYKYEREPGYFLLSTWALNYGVMGGLGLAVALALEWMWRPPFWITISIVAVPVLIGNFLFVRLSKAWFLAFDHYCDPHFKNVDRNK